MGEGLTGCYKVNDEWEAEGETEDVVGGGRRGEQESNGKAFRKREVGEQLLNPHTNTTPQHIPHPGVHKEIKPPPTLSHPAGADLLGIRAPK